MLTPPRILAQAAQRLPTALTSVPFTLGLELARHLTWLTPPAALDGKTFTLTVNDLGLVFSFACRDGRFRPCLSRPAAAALTLSASVRDFHALLNGSADADTLFFQRRLQIRGDTELGLEVKNWLDATERPQWLQQLQRLQQRQAMR